MSCSRCNAEIVERKKSIIFGMHDWVYRIEVFGKNLCLDCFLKLAKNSEVDKIKHKFRKRLMPKVPHTVPYDSIKDLREDGYINFRRSWERKDLDRRFEVYAVNPYYNISDWISLPYRTHTGKFVVEIPTKKVNFKGRRKKKRS